MYDIIAPTLFQKRSCRLPGIGSLVMVTEPSINRRAEQLIDAPSEKIEFLPESGEERIFNEFSAFSELMRKSLEGSGVFLLKGIGTFHRSKDGSVEFLPVKLDPLLAQPVHAPIVARPELAHAVLIGDQQTNSHEIQDVYRSARPARDNWWIWAILLGAIGTAALLYYLNKYGVNGFSNISY